MLPTLRLGSISGRPPPPGCRPGPGGPNCFPSRVGKHFGTLAPLPAGRAASSRPDSRRLGRSMALSEDADGLSRRPANFVPLSPVSFLARADPRPPATHGGHRRRATLHLRRDGRAVPPAGLRARAAGRPARGDGLGPRPQHPDAARGPLRRSDGPGGAQRDQRPARPAERGLHPPPRPGAASSSSTPSWRRSPPRPSRSSRRSPSWSSAGEGRRDDGYERLLASGDPRAPLPASRPTSGTRSASTTRPAPPAIRRARCTTTAART